MSSRGRMRFALLINFILGITIWTVRSRHEELAKEQHPNKIKINHQNLKFVQWHIQTTPAPISDQKYYIEVAFEKGPVTQELPAYIDAKSFKHFRHGIFNWNKNDNIYSQDQIIKAIIAKLPRKTFFEKTEAIPLIAPHTNKKNTIHRRIVPPDDPIDPAAIKWFEGKMFLNS